MQGDSWLSNATSPHDNAGNAFCPLPVKDSLYSLGSVTDRLRSFFCASASRRNWWSYTILPSGCLLSSAQHGQLSPNRRKKLRGFFGETGSQHCRHEGKTSPPTMRYVVIAGVCGRSSSSVVSSTIKTKSRSRIRLTTLTSSVAAGL